MAVSAGVALLHQPMLHSECRRLKPGMDLELGQDALHVRPHGVLADPDGFGDA